MEKKSTLQKYHEGHIIIISKTTFSPNLTDPIKYNFVLVNTIFIITDMHKLKNNMYYIYIYIS